QVSKDLEQEEAEFAESEARLTAALLNGEEGESDISENELKAIMSAMRAQAQAGSANERESSTRAQKRLLVVVERSRTKNQELAEHIRKQSELIHDLQNQTPRTVLAATPKEETPLPPPPKDPPMRPPSPSSSEAEIQLEATLRLNANLHRELDLVTSAWHEQNRRFASGGMVTLRTRASPEPRSFLGKHRKMIDIVALGGSARS
ncbi:MAG: hypothetical protein M1823_006881, partial [Watsoniomyces obsoletus]